MVIHRVLAVWGLFIPLAILNGALRESLLIPLIGKSWALPLSGILLSCLILFTTYILFPFMKLLVQRCWLVGTMWLILTVMFKFGFGHFVMGNTWHELLRAYDVSGGNLWDLVLLVTFLSPYLTAKLRGPG